MNRFLIAALCFVVGCLAASAIARWAEPDGMVPVEEVVIGRSPLPDLPILEPPAGLGDRDSLGCWSNEHESPRFGPSKIGPDRYLSTLCETMFVKDGGNNVVWQRRICGFTDLPRLVDGEIVFIGYDLCLGAVDPATGDYSWQFRASGRSGYVQLLPYGSDTYLIRVDRSGYDHKYMDCYESPRCARSEGDSVWLLRKGEHLDAWEVPAGSKIEVLGRRIYASFKRGSKRVLMKIR